MVFNGGIMKKLAFYYHKAMAFIAWELWSMGYATKDNYNYHIDMIWELGYNYYGDKVNR